MKLKQAQEPLSLDKAELTDVKKKKKKALQTSSGGKFDIVYFFASTELKSHVASN